MGEKYSVLVMDYDDSTRKFYTRTLKAIPALQVKEAKNGKEALRTVKKSAQNIIVCDLVMPGMDGLELCRHLKGDPGSDKSDVYLIMVGAREAKKDKIECMSEGADDYLFKPVDPDELIARVKVGQRVAAQLRKNELEARKMFQEIDVLLVQDGGCAPGYNPITAFITLSPGGRGKTGICHAGRVQVSGYQGSQ